MICAAAPAANAPLRVVGANRDALAIYVDGLEHGVPGVLVPPVELPPFPIRFCWSSRLANIPANRWIRKIILETYTELERTSAQLAAAKLPRKAARRA